MGTSDGARKGWTEESRRKRAESMRRKWEDPEYRARRAAMEQDPQTKANRSAGAARANADPEKRRKHSEAMTEKWANDESFRERQSAGLRKAAEDPEYRRVRSEASKRAWQENREAFVNSLRASLENARSAEGRQTRKENMLRLLGSTPPTSREMAVGHVLSEIGCEYQFHATHEGREMDLYLPEHRINIEVDGVNHTGANREKDSERDDDLRAKGYTILRLPHREVDSGAFIEKIAQLLAID